MINEKLAQHISNELWVQKSKVVEVLGSYVEEVWQPIVGEWCKYRDNDYCKVEAMLTDTMYQVYTLSDKTYQSCTIDDLSKWTPTKGEKIKGSDNGTYWYETYYLWKNGDGTHTMETGNHTYKFIRPLQSKDTPQRDYTGVRFKHSCSDEVRVIEKGTIHASKPSDIEERVRALELAIFGSKRNLSIETQADWKKVECLSWEEMKEILSSGVSIENYVKNKLKH